MRIIGFTFIRNGVRLDYPFRESLQCLSDLCDEVVVAVGDSDDSTRSAIEALSLTNLRLLDTVWDATLRTGGQILAQQTNLALDLAERLGGDWGLYLQGDELLHEQHYFTLRQAMTEHLANRAVEGLVLPYYHFFGSYDYVGVSRRWYRREVRVIRLGLGVRSFRDAQGFRRQGKKLNVKLVQTPVFHYGWVRNPSTQAQKAADFNKLWHPDGTPLTTLNPAFNFQTDDLLAQFTGSHPRLMQTRIAAQNWTFDYHPSQARLTLKEQCSQLCEKYFGWRPGEYQNYRLI